ncbi:MAG: ATP-binding protein [Solobacterium sp.]|nr:ATP-binding protein [Solobacterium sp.]
MSGLSRELVVSASVEHLQEVLSFLEETLIAASCPKKQRIQIVIAAEEVFVNIASYAYPPGTGTATIRVELTDDASEVTIKFCDRGICFDPLRRPDPDITLSAEEREIGGLGIFMTRKFMDEVTYDYQDGQNILTIKKKFLHNKEES